MTKFYTQVLVNKGTTFSFGKYKGKTVREVLRDDPSYIIWLHENEVCSMPDEILDEACDKDMDRMDSDVRRSLRFLDPYDLTGDDA